MFRGIAILILLFIIAVFIPIFGSISLIFTPLPILYYGVKLGRTEVIIITVMALFIISIMTVLSDMMIDLMILYFLFGSLGLILSETLRRGYSIEKTIIYPTLFVCLISFLLLCYESQQAGKEVVEFIELDVAGNINKSIGIYAKLNRPFEQINLLKENASRITHFLTRIYPSIVLVFVSFAVWLNVLSARLLFKKNTVPYPSFGDLTVWKAPEMLVWLVIAGGLISFLTTGGYKFIGLNIIIICAFIYLMQGLAIISFLFKRKNVPSVLKIVFYFLIFAQQYILLIVIAVGLFDLWINFRKYIKPINNQAA